MKHERIKQGWFLRVLVLCVSIAIVAVFVLALLPRAQ
jgi:ABC-type transport system involved in cytochrome c biogenesis permease subunit